MAPAGSTTTATSRSDPARAAEQVAAAAEAGVERLITVGCDVAQSAAYVELARRHPGVVWATAGVHPHDASAGIDGLEALLDAPRGGGRGGVRPRLPLRPLAPRRAARRVRRTDRAGPHAHDLALVIHTREAWAETFAILAAEGVPERTVFHCFTGGPDEARAASTSARCCRSAAS